MMDELMSEEELAMDVDIPEPEHIETIMDGIGDSISQVAGTESLTNAQIYLGSVLAANGYIRRNQVGQEGFMSKVGDGFKAAIAYIKKMFTNIWDFFFKRDAPKLVAEAKEEVQKAEEVLKVVETGGSNEKETTLALTNMRKVALALSHEPDTNKAALDQILKEADEAMKGDQAKKKAAVLMIGRELPKLNKRSANSLKKRAAEIVKHVEEMDNIIGRIIQDASGSDNSPSYKALADGLRHGVAEIGKVLGMFRKASWDPSVETLKKLHTYSTDNISVVESEHKSLEQSKPAIAAEIKKLESSDGEGAKKEVADLKKVLSGISAIIQCNKGLLSSTKAMIKTGNKAFGY